MFDLSGKRAVVTGAAGGIGQAIALALAGNGADVAVLDIAGPEECEATRQGIEETGRRSVIVQGDVSDADQVEAFASRVTDELGGLDIWVNNAARLLVRNFLDMSHAEWHGLLATNLHGYFYGCKAAAARMVPLGLGRIINITSVTRTQAVSELTAYITAKAAVHGLTISLALELGATGVTVNAIAPGATETPLTKDFYTPEVRSLYESRIAVGRVALPSDYAAAAVFLASDEASYVCGHELLVDGGMSLNGNVGFAETPAAD